MKDNTYQESELVEVFVAPDELMATMVKDMLESEGIDAAIRCDQIVWYDSIAKASRGYWGKVFVRSEDEDRAKELVAEFLKLGNSAGQETVNGEEVDDQE
jgi:glutathione synthase/RimK-type ligase-like ATP-grasp enzyme